jgi:hypothetical protein
MLPFSIQTTPLRHELLGWKVKSFEPVCQIVSVCPVAGAMVLLFQVLGTVTIGATRVT